MYSSKKSAIPLEIEKEIEKETIGNRDRKRGNMQLSQKKYFSKKLRIKHNNKI